MSKIRQVPMQGLPQEHYMLLNEMRAAIIKLQGSTLPPDDPTNLTVTPIALGNNIQFTRSGNAQRYTLYISNFPSRDADSTGGSIAIDLGNTNNYTDIVGKDGFARYYWVKGWNGNLGSRLIGPKSGVTLAAAATITPPPQVPAGSVIAVDQTNNQHVSVGGPVGGRRIIP